MLPPPLKQACFIYSEDSEGEGWVWLGLVMLPAWGGWWSEWSLKVDRESDMNLVSFLERAPLSLWVQLVATGAVDFVGEQAFIVFLPHA